MCQKDTPLCSKQYFPNKYIDSCLSKRFRITDLCFVVVQNWYELRVYLWHSYVWQQPVVITSCCFFSKIPQKLLTNLYEKMKIILLLILTFIVVPLRSQVGINTKTPHKSAALEITSPTNNQGVLLPRMNTISKAAINSPASGLLVYDTDKQCLSQNVGSGTNPIWICLAQNQTRFFYMPSVAISAKTLGVVATPLDLYNEYKKQFATPMAKSNSAPVAIPYFPVAADLHYYITYYDSDVIKINSVSNDGKVSYEIIKVADYNSFMNVVFVVK